MKYQVSCKWCRKTFEAKRKDNIFCSSVCKTDSWHIHKDFSLVEKWVDEETVQAKYKVSQGEACVIYLQWFKMDKKRYADVYLSKNCSISLKRFKLLPQTVLTVPVNNSK